MNKYEENLELMKNKNINEFDFLEKRIYNHKNTIDIVLSEVAKSYNYYRYLKELFYITEEELQEEANKQLHDDYRTLICNEE